jgi:hypothetical protein
MRRVHVAGLGLLIALCVMAAALAAFAQTPLPPAPPLYATTKVDGTDNVYIFRYVRHQAMFVVTPDGVIATDPIGLRRPAAQAYIEEIRKITPAPIKYVIYSHAHFTSRAGSRSRTWVRPSWHTEMPGTVSLRSTFPMWWCRTRWWMACAPSISAAPRLS